MAHPLPNLTLVCLVAALAGLPAWGQTNPAAERGHAYARDRCAACHAVEPGIAAQSYNNAPSFLAIVATPGMTSMALSAWFVTSHPNMPNLVIRQRDKEDLLAWFAVLREAHKQAELPH